MLGASRAQEVSGSLLVNEEYIGEGVHMKKKAFVIAYAGTRKLRERNCRLEFHRRSGRESQKNACISFNITRAGLSNHHSKQTHLVQRDACRVQEVIVPMLRFADCLKPACLTDE